MSIQKKVNNEKPVSWILLFRFLFPVIKESALYNSKQDVSEKENEWNIDILVSKLFCYL